MKDRPDLPAARFFKVILPSTITQRKLRIPEKFVEKHGHELHVVARLTDPVGVISYVGFERVENSLWLSVGWDKFIEDHSISCGYFLLFKYKGNSSFSVRVFDLTATEVHYPHNGNRNFEATNHSCQDPISETEEHSDDNSIEVLASCPGKPGICLSKNGAPKEHTIQSTHDATEKSKFQHFYLRRGKCKIEDGWWARKKEKLNISSYDISKVSHTSRPLFDKSSQFCKGKAKNLIKKTVQEDGYLVGEARNIQKVVSCTEGNQNCRSNENPSPSAIKSLPRERTVPAAGRFLPNNPWFTLVMKPYNLFPMMTLNVPITFTREYLPRAPKHIELHDSNGKKWLVRALVGRQSVRAFGKGWGSFAKEKNLKIGDTCVFEVICINKPMLKVLTFCNSSSPEVTSTDMN